MTNLKPLARSWSTVEGIAYDGTGMDFVDEEDAAGSRARSASIRLWKSPGSTGKRWGGGFVSSGGISYHGANGDGRSGFSHAFR